MQLPITGETARWLAIPFGMLFGMLLHRGGVANYNVIVNQFRFRDFTVLKIMLTAIVIGGVGVWWLHGAGHAEYHIKPANLLGVALGAALFGVGMVLYGYCPGTGVAAIATGSLHALTGFGGMLAGATLYALSYSWVELHIQPVAALGKARLPELTGMPDWAWFGVLIVVAGVVFWWLETRPKPSPAGQRNRVLAVMFLALLPIGMSAASGQDIRRDTEAAIDSHRKGVLTIEAAPGTEITVEQQRHEFWFGAALANQAFGDRMPVADRERYLTTFLTNFNSAVTENALKWHDMERERGQVNYGTVDAILAWTEQNRLPLRGHNIFWGIPGFVQPWLKELPDDQLRGTLRNRALDIGRRYKGRFAEYDLNNEMIHGNYYEQRLGTNITLQMAQWVREGDPKAVLYLNDYDILTGKRLDDYVRQIRALLGQGVPIGGIGVQGHLHGDTFDAQALRDALEKLSVFKLPIRVTEFNFPGQRSRYYQNRGARLTDEEEKAKAQALVDYYRICFSFPQVEGILMWGFWEGANWIPVSSLYRRDWTPLPAAEAYRNLVFGEWWTRWQGRADASGKCQVRAFYGRHRVTAGTKQQIVNLARKDGTATVTFK